MSRTKVISAESLRRKLPGLRRKGYKIAFTNGCFDILHYGHVSYLQKASNGKRILIVGLNSDSSVKKLKGPKRPIIKQSHRAANLAALECVDYIVLFSAETPLKLVSSLKPDILIKGADYKRKEVVGREVVEKNGGRVEFISFVKGCSTTEIIKTIIKKCRS